MLHYLGAICIFLFAFYIIFSYERYQKLRLLQAEAFFLFMKMLRDELQGLGRSVAQLCAQYESEVLEGLGFLQGLREGLPAGECFARVRKGLSVPEALVPVLHRTFDGLGQGSRTEAQHRLCTELSHAEQVLSEERRAQGDRLRLCRTLTAASAMGLVILLL